MGQVITSNIETVLIVTGALTAGMLAQFVARRLGTGRPQLTRRGDRSQLQANLNDTEKFTATFAL
jgi:hypothetical protein